MQRLSKYDPAVTPTLCGHLAARGLTDEQIAELLRVPENTFKSWRHRNPEFKQAMQQGKDFVDALVEGTLLKGALGYDYAEVTRERIEVGKKADGTLRFKMVITKRVMKHQPGNVASQFIWLKNRKPAIWKDRQHVIVSQENPYEQMNNDELLLIASGNANGNGAGNN